MDFALLPPELNSARMYAGPGSAPMLAVAAAWDGLAADLEPRQGGDPAEFGARTPERPESAASAPRFVAVYGSGRSLSLDGHSGRSGQDH